MKYPISLSQDLKRNPYRGNYFAFEGIDGCGKSTQVENIRKHLEKLSLKVVTTSEPMHEGKIQKVIREALYAKIKIPSRSYQDLYSADRSLNHTQIVEPSLKKGDTVLTHRSFWSAVAYGILDLGEDYNFLNTSSILVSQGIFSYYHQFLAPGKTFYIRVSAEHAIQRIKKMDKAKDIYERVEKLAKIVTGYEQVVKEFASEFVVIDGEKSEEEVTEEIIKNIQIPK